MGCLGFEPGAADETTELWRPLNSSPNINPKQILLKNMFFNFSQKSYQIFGLLCKKIVENNFHKLPNLVTLLA